MSEVISRPSASRGRGSGRGGRGGFAGRGGRRANGDKTDHKTADDNLGTFEDEGEFAELRKQYGDKTSVIREMFPDWSEADVLYALKETNGDETEAVTRIADGTLGDEFYYLLFLFLPLFVCKQRVLHTAVQLQVSSRFDIHAAVKFHLQLLIPIFFSLHRYNLAVGRGLQDEEDHSHQGQGYILRTHQH